MSHTCPKRDGYVLTQEAEDLYADWLEESQGWNCSCHISPPCGYCTHPGNPLNIEETEEYWIPESDETHRAWLDGLQADAMENFTNWLNKTISREKEYIHEEFEISRQAFLVIHYGPAAENLASASVLAARRRILAATPK